MRVLVTLTINFVKLFPHTNCTISPKSKFSASEICKIAIFENLCNLQGPKFAKFKIHILRNWQNRNFWEVVNFARAKLSQIQNSESTWNTEKLVCRFSDLKCANSSKIKVANILRFSIQKLATLIEIYLNVTNRRTCFLSVSHFNWICQTHAKIWSTILPLGVTS